MANGVTVTTAIRKQREGYQARIDVQATGQKRYFHYGFGKTPIAAMKAAHKQIDADLSPSKRGRKPGGYRSLLLLERGW